MPNRDIIVMGASAGGIETLKVVLGGIPPDVPACILAVVHIPPSGGRALQRILSRASQLEVLAARHGEPLKHGRVYVGIGDHHLLVGDGVVQVTSGPRENGHRPAADPLFRSAAAYYGTRVIGVVLSGTLSDGTAGLLTVRRRGGLVVVQDPADAMYDGMPSSALEYAGADYVVASADMGRLLSRLALEDVDPSQEAADDRLRKEVQIMESGDGGLDEHQPGTPSPWPCPDCNGVLWAIEEGPVLRFRCRVGHAWAAESLLERQDEGVEAALWMALRALEDRADLSRTLAQAAQNDGRPLSAERFRSDLERMTESIGVLHRLLGTASATAEGSADKAVERDGR
jgi:two-component system chemotaxis response regulator CheB